MEATSIVMWDWIIISEFTVTDTEFRIYWAEFPYFRTRQTVYQLEEIMEWAKDQPASGTGKDADQFLESYEESVREMLFDFHEFQTKAPWKLENQRLEKVINFLQREIDRYSRIIDALSKRIMKPIFTKQ